MTHHKYLSIIGVAGIVSWIAWIVVLNKLDPMQSPELALGMFYLSLFFAMTCTFTVIGFYFRMWMYKNEVFYNHIHIAFRQALLLTVIALGCLTFLLLKVLTWWSGLLLIAVVTMVEFYFAAREPV